MLTSLDISIRTESEAELIISTIINITRLNGVLINRTVLKLASEIERRSRDREVRPFVNDTESRPVIHKLQSLNDHLNAPLPDTIQRSIRAESGRHSK